MKFKDLDEQTKEYLNTTLIDFANSLGGINFFLQLIEDIKKEKENPLLNKSSAYPYSKGRISWNKKIYKDTLVLLYETMKLEEKDSDFLQTLKPKAKKNTINMMKTLKPVLIDIKPKNELEGQGFSLNIIDSRNEEDIKISLLFKIVFFYNISFAKEVISYKKSI
ncbi:hypothetical protein CPU12_05445 [Malaciobacter molluscorum LMG 25693]|uniref:Uncharacterized protein n=1 Tax=Malaciobacter molluscorum LMG 25693 TaxID=870501 RepID=A0A2G1DIX7_9BACT|nr:hypothetical protein [Malaciobacter molluscorum]AXX93182.1 hypothetical protein AMOL_2229 [Malaciobacter molluscorum LMG 25693]PHO18437.1 hypothetical protein CPU12_05445 [Malaciobacter molluscorum LMG 25693]RXJ95636.1 hypothetical protein CRV00_04125 [Malaciobacter molluscorum]